MERRGMMEGMTFQEYATIRNRDVMFEGFEFVSQNHIETLAFGQKSVFFSAS